MENFEILEKLGEGSYSTVYKVKRKLDNQIYALKKVRLLNLNEREKTNSLNEVRILASVKSNYVISYKEAFFDEKDSTLGIVMEYADNGDLYQKIIEYKKKKIFFEEIEIWKIFIQLVKGLKALHDLQILHRDLKSANVFLFKDGHAKLGDLNVSKVAKRGLGYTQTGTPYYASPEIWKDLPYDNKSDIWSLGCVLYEMITLHPPFRAKNMDELYKKVLSGDIGNLPNKFSNDLYEVVLLLMKVNSNKRPTCGEILKNDLVKKRIEFFNSMKNNSENEGDLINIDEKDEQALLKTIRIPKNLLFLSNQLPKPNYNKQRAKIEVKNITKNHIHHHHNHKNVRTRLPKLNINSRQTEETKSQNSISIACMVTKQNSISNEKEENNNDTNNINNNNNNTNNINNKNNNNTNNINNNNNNINNSNNNNNDQNAINIIDNSNFDIKNEVQFYKKLHSINKKLLNPIRRNKSLEKNTPYDYSSINININSNISHLDYNIKNNLNNNITNKYKKLYKLYEPNKNQNEVKKMPKFKILNGMRNNNNKYNAFWKNREELYKDLYKKIGLNSELMQMIPRDKVSTMEYSDGSSSILNQLKIDNEIKIFKNKNKLNPITICRRDSNGV